ncbi:MAG: DUF2089 domain-containing protein [Tissierellia bacterium]|nr:DUF2089 domain-containing protein [Tissierellia bacterium]
MSYPVINTCSVCGDQLKVSSLHCDSCNTHYQGDFHFDKFTYLSAQQKNFIEVFLKCRGNIREVEKELEISYPTVRARLDDVISSLGYDSSVEDSQASKKEAIDSLSKGEISYEEALKIIKDQD